MIYDDDTVHKHILPCFYNLIAGLREGSEIFIPPVTSRPLLLHIPAVVFSLAACSGLAENMHLKFLSFSSADRFEFGAR